MYFEDNESRWQEIAYSESENSWESRIPDSSHLQIRYYLREDLIG